MATPPKAPPTASAQFRPGLLWGFIGDSITNGSSASNFLYSYAPVAIAMAGGMVARLDSIEAGTPGERSDQMLTRVGALLGMGIQAMVILAGTNDAGQSNTLTTTINSLTGIIKAAKRRGIPVVLCTPPPAGASQANAVHQRLAAITAWVRIVGPSLGCEIADVYRALANSTSGAMLSGYDSGDGVHPNDLGHQVMAVPVAKAMMRVANKSAPYQGLITAGAATGSINLIADPLNTRAVPTTSPWSEQSGGTGTAPAYAMKADGTGGALPYGQWAEVDFDGTASGGTRILGVPTTDFAVGDVLIFCGNMQVEDVSGTWISDVTNGLASIRMQLVNQSAVLLPGSQPTFHCAGIPQASNPTVYDLGPVVLPVTVPVGTTQIIARFSATVNTGKHIKARFGCVGLLHATRIGLNSYLGSWGSAMVNT